MRILLDECVDWRFARDIIGHDVRTVRQEGWTGFKNGELLKLAAGRFDVFVTLDGNLPNQQSIHRAQIAIIILKARTSRLPDVRLLASGLLAVLPQMVPGTIKLIGD